MGDDHNPFGKAPSSDPFEQQAVNERARRAAFPSMSDQAIRAHALECAVGVAGLVANTHPSNPMSEFWSLAQQFEAYIRDGVT